MDLVADLGAIACLVAIWGLMAGMATALERLAAPKGKRP
jgi:hypothetical protein